MKYTVAVKPVSEKIRNMIGEWNLIEVDFDSFCEAADFAREVIREFAYDSVWLCNNRTGTTLELGCTRDDDGSVHYKTVKVQ